MNQHEFDLNGGPGGGLGSLVDGLNWDHVRSEVVGESQARVAIAGLAGAGKSMLLNSLRGWEVSPAGDARLPGQSQEDLGLFVLLDLAAEGPAAAEEWNGLDEAGATPGVWETLTQADVILFLFDGALHQPSGELPEQQAAMRQQARQGEYRWYCRIQALGRPVVAAMSKADLWPDEATAGEAAAVLARRLAAVVTPLCAMDGDGAAQAVLPRLLEANPKLLVALGRELPALRRQAANTLIKQTTLFAALAGLQPVPLLDLPLQLGLQMRLLLRLDALYGRSHQGDVSRELVASLAGGMAVRLLAQTLAKFVPVLGWAISGALSGLSAWLLGWGAVALLEGRHRQLRQAAAELAARRPAVAVRLPALPARRLRGRGRVRLRREGRQDDEQALET
mgnify:CR=1 FL=1|jgi:uncharacterized protein (DUF697 family)